MWAGQAKKHGARHSPHVIAEQEFQSRPAKPMHFRRFAFNPHAVDSLRPAGRHEPARIGQLDDTDLARAGWLVALQETKRRDINAQLAGGGQHGRSGRDFHFAVIDSQSWHEIARTG